MKYALLIYYEEKHWYEASPEQKEKEMGEYFAFGNEMKTAGKMLGGDALQPVSTARSVRLRNGEALYSDGPFAETKEQLGGFYLLDCESLEEAAEQARKIPASRYGTIEVRPIMEFDQEE